MTPGQLDRRIVIERKVATPDPDFGTEQVTWVPVDGYEPGSPTTPRAVAASIRDALVSRAEGVRNGLELAANQSRLRIRYRTGIDSSMRIREPARGNQTFQIISGPSEVGRREFLEFVIEKYTTTGENA
jgi:head-tail adaptor